ncbi:outer membrane lipoprotein chaperone LolA [Cognaticolwellia mytili]|uniref:outer membrane lipoprotein chaperone LolA n=1 Tax=Cognaticolwellia mytili TaxID=1888913 RepID=UPI000A172DCE|nr:outer membrane lipoprotein chaperone LolA [Cognaticolwellia mytili]
MSKVNLVKRSVVIATLFNTVLSTSSFAENSVTVDNVVAQNTVMSTTQINESNSKTDLMSKLAKIDFFSAKFSQKIFDESGNELQQGSGQLSVSKPNLVNWETKLPDESLIVSDGSNLWFYDPFVEQVSVYTLESAIANTPILLITNNDPKLWQDYNVSQLADNRYLIQASSDNSRVKSLELTFENNDSAEEKNTSEKLIAFNILDATGQLSIISLSEHDNETNTDLFKFTVPEGVYLDDQR